MNNPTNSGKPELSFSEAQVRDAQMRWQKFLLVIEAWKPILKQPSHGQLYVWTCPQSAAQSAAEGLVVSIRLHADSHGAVSIKIRGRKCHSHNSSMVEIGAALQFPSYFGENFSALDECLQDLSWLPADAYVIVVIDADQLFMDQPLKDFQVLLRLFLDAAIFWETPQEDENYPRRAARPFHWIFQVEETNQAALLERLRAAGIEPIMVGREGPIPSADMPRPPT